MAEAPGDGVGVRAPLEVPRPEPAPVAKRARGLRRVGLALVLGALAVVGLALARPEVRTRLRVLWLARGLEARDPMARTNARQALLDVGRPAIDCVFPRLVASEVADEVTGVEDAAVVVAHEDERWPRAKPPETEQRLLIEELLRAPPGESVGPGWSVRTDAAPVCPVAQRLVNPDSRRKLVVYAVHRPPSDVSFMGPLPIERRVEVPLDDDLAPEVIEAVRERLARE